jgi:hypothetical protein
MQRRLTLLGVVVGVVVMVVLFAARMQAHHAFAAEFDANNPITIKGTITKLEWVNPHSWLHLDVKQPEGAEVDGRGRPSNQSGEARLHEDVGATGHGSRRAGIPVAGPRVPPHLPGKRPRHRIRRWQEAVHGLFGYGCAARWARSDREEEVADAHWPPS